MIYIELFTVNWITMTRKSGEHLRAKYGNTGQLFWPYQFSSAVYKAISSPGDLNNDHRMQSRNFTTDHPSTSHISDAKWTSHGNCAAN